MIPSIKANMLKKFKEAGGKAGDNKKVRNAKKCEYNGIKFDSSLELFCYKQLELNHIEFKYQPTNYLLFDKFDISFLCYEAIGKVYKDKETKKIINDTRRFDLVPSVRDIKYTPDFVDTLHDKWIIEIKGFANDSFPLRWKLLKRYLEDINFTGVLFKPENQTQVLQCIEIIKQL